MLPAQLLDEVPEQETFGGVRMGPPEMWSVPEDFPPNINQITKIKDAWEGLYTDTTKIRPGVGGVVNSVTELLVLFIAREFQLRRDLMNPDAVSYIDDWAAADPKYFRPEFIMLFRALVREAFLSGFLVYERWFPHLDAFSEVRDVYLLNDYGEQAGAQPADYFPAEPCGNVIPRPAENFLIGRDKQSGFIWPAPFWYTVDFAKGQKTGDWIGPYHRDQMVYGALHKTSISDWYGMGLYVAVYTEIKNIGLSFKVAGSAARRFMKPRIGAALGPDAGETEMDNARVAINDFLIHMDQDKYESALLVPGATNIFPFYPQVKFSDISKYIRELHSMVLAWLGIPETLFFSVSNRSVAEVQSKLFTQRVSQYRRIMWSWWEWHFRQVLRENEFEDWQKTPVEVDWVIDFDLWDSKDENISNLVDAKPELQTPLEDLYAQVTTQELERGGVMR